MIQGGRDRGLIIHKLFEEVLANETGDDRDALIERAAALIRAKRKFVTDNPKDGLSPGEIAGCIVRTLSLPEIVALRPTLVPEFPVHASETVEGTEHITNRIADAINIGTDDIQAIVD